MIEKQIEHLIINSYLQHKEIQIQSSPIPSSTYQLYEKWLRLKIKGRIRFTEDEKLAKNLALREKNFILRLGKFYHIRLWMAVVFI